MPYIKVGEKIPSAILYEETPDNERNIAELVAGKKAIVFGVPGAFVPGCSRVHLRGFVEKADELRSQGYEEIICVSVNDPFVMAAWGWSRGADYKVRLLADPAAAFTSALKMGVEVPELGGLRSRRYSMVTVNGVVKELYVDAPNVKLVCMQNSAIPTYCT